MTADEVKARVLRIVAKYDRGIFTIEAACDALWQLAQATADDERQTIALSHGSEE